MRRTKHPLILHVDDDIDSLELFTLTFSSLFNIISANSVKEAFDVLEKKNVSALVTDYEMPDMNGIDLLKIMREKHPQVPVIFYTGQGNEEIAREAFVSGAADYFVKDLTSFAHKERLSNSIITAIERTEAYFAHKESEERFRIASEIATDLVYEFDVRKDRYFFYGNVDKKKRFALKKLPRSKKDWVNLVHPDDIEKVTKAFQQHENTPGFYSHEYRIIPEKGNIRHWRDSGISVLDDKGEVLKVTGVITDITDTKLFLSREKEHKKKLKTLTETGTELAQISSEDKVFDYIHSKLGDLLDNCYVLINAANEDNSTFKVRYILGADSEVLDKLKSFGVDIFKIDFPVDDKIRETYLQNRLVKVEEGIQRLVAGMIPDHICNLIEHTFQLGDKHIIGFTKEGLYFGSIIIIMQNEHKLKDPDIIETFVNQVREAFLRIRAERAIKESEARFRIAARSRADFICEIDMTNRRILWYGDIFERLGCKSDKKTESFNFWKKIIHKNDYEDLREKIYYAIRENRTVEHKFRVTGKDGRTLTWKGTGTVVSSEEGMPVKIIGAVTDVTDLIDKKKQEEEYIKDLKFLSSTTMGFLELSEDDDIYHYIVERIKELVGNCLVTIALLDQETKNVRLAGISGLSKRMSNILFHSGINIFAKKYPITEAQLDQLREDKLYKVDGGINEVTSSQLPRNLCKFAEDIFGFKHIYAMGLSNRGNLIGDVVVIMKNKETVKHKDILEIFIRQAAVALSKRVIEEKYGKSEKRYKKLVQLSPNGIIVCIDEKIVFVNNSGIKLLEARNGGEMMEQSIYHYIHDSSLARVRRTINEERRTGELILFREEKIISQRGKLIDVELACSNLIFHDKPAVLLVMTDITERKRIENKLLRVNKELNDFAYIVSHDLKNSLNIIKGFLQAMRFKPEKNEYFMEKAMNKTDESIGFVEKLLKLAQAGEVVSKKVTIPLKKMLTSIFESNVSTLHMPNKLIISEDLPEIFADPIGINQIFSNLIQNSVKFADPAKEQFIISINFERKENKLYIYFKDNGKGIPKASLPKIFIPGYSAGDRGGTGFGLAITKKLVEAHEGMISADSGGPGEGTTFTIEFPSDIEYIK